MFYPGGPFDPLYPISPVLAGGLSEHQVMCRGNTDQRSEMRFSVKEGAELSTCVYTNMKNDSIGDAKNTEYMKEVLAGLSAA